MKRLLVIIFSSILLFTSSVSFGDLTVKPNAKYGKIYIVHTEINKNVRVFNRLIRKLNSAKRGEIVYIVVVNNTGGWMHTLSQITRAIKRSRATVIIEGRGYIYSAAAHLLFQGDQAKVHHKTQILFHNIRYSGFLGRTIIPSKNNRNSAKKRIIYRQSLAWYRLGKVRTMLTRQEWSRLLNGKNVVIQGARICSLGKTVRVLKRGKGYCFIRGVK